MSMKRLARACLAGAVLCVAASRVAAHPPDLPVDTKEVCVPYSEEECGELDTRKPCEPREAANPMLCEILSRFCQSFAVGFGGVPVIDLDLEFFCGEPEYISLEECIQMALESGSTGVEDGASTAAPAKGDGAQRAHARKMYLIGERCRRAGDFEMAENCYVETRLLCPGCDYAGKAERRIRLVRALRAAEAEDIGEESEPVKEETPKGDKNCEYEVPPPAVVMPSGEVDYHIRLDVPGFSRISQQESEEALRQRMRQEARSRGEKLLFETDLAKLAEAKAMYYVGERCRRGGDLDMAYRCYKDASHICPQCRHGKKARLRMRQVNEQKQRELQQGSVSSDVPFLAASFTLLDSEVVRTFERLAEETSPSPTGIEIVLEESRPMLEGDEEEADYPLTQCAGASAPPTYYIAPAPRHLVLGEEQEEAAQAPETPACEDLSDWLPQAVRLMHGAGSLRIDTAWLGRLMARGEGAVRALGCSLTHECGRTFVVYPGR